RDKEIREVVLTDVCPFTLGTEVMVDNGLFEEGGHYLPIIERNTVIPVSRTQTVYTARDGQTRVNVKVLQGESRMAYNNLLLGEVSVPVPEGPKGRESVDITYTYDVNSLLEVEIRVNSTGVTRKVIIQNEQNRISEEEAAARMEKLQYLKQNPRHEEANKLLLLRSERLYERFSGETRMVIDRAVMEFERVLAKQDRTEIERARKKLAKLLDEIEFDTRR
ncbi:MAG: Hsp70 family protein, partial [Oscillospiraceae bacterium]|nr:Hsp70 family protein [Oscillospiraceae bacterium]